MALQKDLESLMDNVERRKYLCPVARLIDDVEQKDGNEAAEQALRALASPAFGAESLCQVFRRNGYKISVVSIRNHRHSGCSCGD